MRKSILIICMALAGLVQARTFDVAIKTNHVSPKEKSYAGLTGGDTLMLEAGARSAIQFADLEGLPGNYITIINAPGISEINAGILPYGISLRNCHYIRLTGTGSKKYPYGIRIAEVGHGGAGLGISERSDNIEVCHLEICNTDGPGILCKTNPDCLTYRENYTMLNTSIHNNYVHHTGTEGMYIGSTAFEGTRIKCNNDSVTHFPPFMKNVEVYENLVEYTGWDGIQISYATNVKCFRNQIHFDSQKDVAWQNCGLIIGGGATGRFYENTISNGKGFPINCFGAGQVEITGNSIIQDSSSTKLAIYINDKLADKLTHYILRNNSIQTRHTPVITLVNNLNRMPDLIEGNRIRGVSKKDAVTFEGVKPVIK